MTADTFSAIGSYSGDPSASDRDAVRFELSDTGPVFEFGDAEIDYLLTRGGVLLAAAAGADTLAVRFGQRADSETVGDVSVKWGDRAKSMMAVAARLRDRAESEAGGDDGPIELGLAASVSPGPFVWRGIHDYPGAVGADIA